MEPVLTLLQKIRPDVGKTLLYKVIEYTILISLLFSTYQGAIGSSSSELAEAKAARNEQIKGYAVQIGQANKDVATLKEEVENLRSWNKKLSDRVYRLESRAIEGR